MFPQPFLAFFYWTIIAAVDGCAACFGSHARFADRKHTDVDTLSDEQVLDLCNSLPLEDWISPTTGVNCPARLTPDVIGKLVPPSPKGWPSEALAQELVRKRTHIPVPPIRRALPIVGDCSVIVMDYIPGITLAAALPNMSFWQKICTAFTLRSYVRQLRSINHPRSYIPGPLVDGKDAVQCHARIFGPMKPSRGPFATAAQFNHFFNSAMNHSAAGRCCSHHGTLEDNRTLVFSHVDLALRNIIVGDDGQLWLIDFGNAGFYPKWFEYANMKMDDKLEYGKESDLLWRALIPFICDPYFRIYDSIANL